MKDKKEKEVLREQRKKNNEDVKLELNPLYAIKVGNPYESEEMFRDITELIEAVAIHNFKKGVKNTIAEVEELMGEVDLTGGSYGQLDGETTELTKTISCKDWEKLKENLK